MNIENMKILEKDLEQKVINIYNYCQIEYYSSDNNRRIIFLNMITKLIKSSNNLTERMILQSLLKKYLKMMDLQIERKTHQRIGSKIEDTFKKISRKEGKNAIEKTKIFNESIDVYEKCFESKTEKKAIKQAKRRYSFVNPFKIHYRKNEMEDEISEQVKQSRTREILNVCFCTSKEWNLYYKLAEYYKMYYGSLNIPIDFKTKNGIDYDKEGVPLGYWVQFQIRNLILKDRVDKLCDIDAFTSLVSEKEALKVICYSLGINYDKYEDILLHLSLNELLVKVNFLVHNEIPIIYQNNLHEIFAMSSKNMKIKYGLSLKELTDMYFINSVSEERKKTK